MFMFGNQLITIIYWFPRKGISCKRREGRCESQNIAYASELLREGRYH